MVNKEPKRGKCEQCAPLQKEVPIRSPDDLTAAIRDAQRCVASGILTEIPLVVKGRSRFPLITEIKPEGPWDDILGFSFRCPSCGRRYYLGAETYHGSGGSWGLAK